MCSIVAMLTFHAEELYVVPMSDQVLQDPNIAYSDQRKIKGRYHNNKFERKVLKELLDLNG